MLNDPVYLILIIGAMIASQLVGGMLQRRFRQFSQVPVRLTGAQVAEKMLRENGISDVEVISVPGQLTDHYDPRKKTVNLSEVVYAHNSVAAAAVAAHECGHAVQHAKAYAPLQMRSALVPVVSIGSRLVPFLFIAGIVMGLASPLGYYALLGAVVLFAGTTLFSLITLPVEFDASRRALAWIGGSGIMSSADQGKAQSALKWAALTYVVAALASLGQLLYYVMLLAGARRD
jgi:Zn-dependent membrane protease YugP